MSIGKIVALALFSTTIASAQEHFIPTSDVVKVATMAAADEGYSLATPQFYLDELRTPDGREPTPGYTSIALYKGGQILRAYAIRVLTGDIIDKQTCTILRYPDLLRFRSDTMKAFTSKSASFDQIASELGCDHLTSKPATSRIRKSK